MSHNSNPQGIHTGNAVTIFYQGMTRRGLVLAVKNLGNNSNPSLEIDLQTKEHGVCSWKQSVDGGFVTKGN